MPVNQLPSPCWTADGTEEGQHYPDQGEDRKQLPAPCYVAECDGKPGEPCGEELGNDEFAWLHFDSPESARACAPTEGWQIGPDGVVQCPDDLMEATPDDR